MQTLWKVIPCFWFVLFLIWNAHAGAQELPNVSPEMGKEVDLELVLAVDISGSVDAFEAQQQRDGYIAALTHPSVINAIKSSFLGNSAVT